MANFKILHIFGPDTKNSYGILKQLHMNFDNSKHKYLITSYKNATERFPKLKEFDDLYFIPHTGGKIKRIFYFYKLLSNHDLIVWHSLYFTTFKYMLFIYAFKKFLKKSVWIEWGADLYLWKYKNHTIKGKLKNYLCKKIRESFNYVGCSFPVDEIEAKKQFGDNIKCFYTPLPNPKERPTELIELIEKSRPCDLKKQNLIVQIGHNSFTFNNHFKLINSLKKFNDESIRFIIPLTYGIYGINGQYGGIVYKKRVINYAKKNLKNVFIMEQNMPFENYLKLLWAIDVAVFDFDRPCGLGTLRILMLMGKKIFLPANTPYFEFLRSNGLAVYDTNLIPEMSFEEFTRMPEYTNKEWIYDYLNNDKIIEKWKFMFDEVEKELGVKK